jgi:hydrogenase maturation protein HypF
MTRADSRRLRIEIRGAVQGVGFRPFVFRLAEDLGLAGWVVNDSRGVILEAEGPEGGLATFLRRLQEETPPQSVIHSLDTRWLEPVGLHRFEIRHSQDEGLKSAVMLPDLATCGDCLREAVDPEDRRFDYPFTNCTNCGPRFSIIRSLPYDRPNTTMERFVMCSDCDREYRDPRDRRFHAQPNACPVCGPHVTLLDPGGRPIEANSGAIERTAKLLAGGKIVAVKGIGGFHLMVDATDSAAVDLLRQRKGRYEKPLALMVGDLQAAEDICQVDDLAREHLSSPRAPIVLLPVRDDIAVATEVAPGNPRLGIMLAYSPLHHRLLEQVDFPVVATSGNVTDEPICIDNDEALERLRGLADAFLVHNRPIQRHVDDSVLQIVEGDVQPIRRARGLAPMPLVVDRSGPVILAVGGHLKNAIALGIGDRVFLSQHIGDMETPQAFTAFEAVIRDFLEVYDVAPDWIAHDLHPDYPATRWALDPAADQPEGWRARLAGKPTIAVQHHHAHLAACLAEHRIDGPALGVTWDGTGYGPDGTVWGGEFLLGDAASYRRVARLRRFRLPGGDAAVKEPRRVALAALWEMWGQAALDREDLPPIRATEPAERRLLASMLERGFRSPLTSSAGRLFDVAAALIDLRQRVSFEGQAAMALEFIADPSETGAYAMDVTASADEDPILELDWQPTLEELLEDSRRGVDPGIIAARFHNALATAIAGVAEEVGEPRVALTGGCFQNRLLTERTAVRLRESGLDVMVHRQVPANDGGISLGQVMVAAARAGERSDAPGKES